MNSIGSKIESINNYLLNSNCSDFRIRYFDKNKLYLIGSFDLCYYHNIEIIFSEVFSISMETYFDIDLQKPPLQFQYMGNKMFEVAICDNNNTKQVIVCEDIDYCVETVKYYDEEGTRIL